MGLRTPPGAVPGVRGDDDAGGREAHPIERIAERPWWRDAVIYQIYPRSWADSDGDGVGDLRGITEHLEHVAWLGADAIWLNPTTPSPNEDWGYDVSDYYDVHPELGTLDDLDRLVARATELGLKVLLDLVPNHTSDRHPWFLDACSSRDAVHRDWYVWADPAPDGAPPNNWLSVFGGEPAWTWHEPTGQYYLHNFLAAQPDLNWWNEDVRNAIDDILRFWYARGIAGFRIDVAHALIHHRGLPDNPPATDDDDAGTQRIGQRSVYNMNQPEAHDIIRRWRRLSDDQDPPGVLLGETYVFDLETMASFYGARHDELHIAFNFPFALAPFEAGALRSIVDATDAVLPEGATSTWFGSNHDIGRFATRWCGGEDAKIRCALMALLLLGGNVVLYYGDEIGLEEVALDAADVKDPVGVRFGPEAGRDGGRTPMHWSAEPRAGFTGAGVTPWLPVGDVTRANVEDQRADPGSILNFCKRLIAARRSSSDLNDAPYVARDSHAGAWVWERGAATVALNLSDEPLALNDVSGTVSLSTHLDREKARVNGRIDLAPWEGVLLET